MEIKDFIKEAIIQVQQGVREAGDYLRKNDGRGLINPVWTKEKYHEDLIRNIDFDIAITATTEKKGSAGLKIPGLAVDLGASAGRENQTANRIKFSLPIIFPITHKYKNPEGGDGA
ncbi:trypco2 family protein [Methylopila sp. 73B]|uniref:trypco2 family protein n=1 Tax=Methylopila sp. 73B TaxID=1120792 RepID=UPI0012DC118A|nr:trypco2 family protein [Methylopila sp. 73B]